MLAVGGENLIDLVQIEDDDGRPRFAALVGGSPCNVALAAGRQALPTCYLSPVSTDHFGDLIAAALTEAGVQLAAERVSAPSSLAVVTTTAGAPSYSFHRNGSAERQVSLAGLRLSLPAAARILHVGSLALAEGSDAQVWEDFVRGCKEAGMIISIDPNVRPVAISDAAACRQRLYRLLALADIVKLSDEDLRWLAAGRPRCESLAQLIEATAASVLIVTCGAEDVLIAHAGGWHQLAVPPLASLQDSVGAGDVFMASMLVWICRQDWQDRLAAMPLAAKQELAGHACRAAAITCGRLGCDPPTAGELE